MSSSGLQGRYCIANLQIFPFGTGSALVISKQTGLSRILPISAVEPLTHLRGFKTLKQHATDFYIGRRIAALDSLLDRNLPYPLSRVLYSLRKYIRQRGEQIVSGRMITSLERQLADLADLGFMISEKECIGLTTMKPESMDEQIKIQSVGVITKDRPEALHRCLMSFAKNSRDFGRNTCFTVFDDSNNPKIQTKNRAVLAEMTRLFGENVFAYAGLEEKTAYKRVLTDSCKIPTDVIDFALFGFSQCGPTHGANLNSLLLHHAGIMVIALDDDVVCQLVRAADYNPGLALVSVFDPTECRFYTDRKSTLNSAPFVEADFMELHESLLGRNVQNCISGAADRGIDLNSAGPNLVNSLSSQSGAVRVTMTGFLGDSGTTVPRWFFLAGPSRDCLLESEFIYCSAFTSREVARGVNSYAISDSAFLMSCAAGMDNRSLLPPFFPVMRNMEGVFATTLRICFGDSYIGHIPWRVLHDPPEQRSYGPLRIEDAVKPRIADIMILAINSYPNRFMLNHDHGKALQALGNYLCDLAGLPPRDFEQWLHLQLCERMSSDVRWLEQELHQSYDPPPYWREYISSCIRSMQELAAHPECLVARDIIEGRSIAEARALTRDLMRQYGKLLWWWPKLYSHCAELRSAEARLAQQVCY